MHLSSHDVVLPKENLTYYIPIDAKFIRLCGYKGYKNCKLPWKAYQAMISGLVSWHGIYMVHIPYPIVINPINLPSKFPVCRNTTYYISIDAKLTP